MFLVHNLYDGFDAYKIKGLTVEHFRSYQVAAPQERNVTLSCLFIDGGVTAILGTTIGRAMIVDVNKASTKQLLLHSGMNSSDVTCSPTQLFIGDDGLIQEIVGC